MERDEFDKAFVELANELETETFARYMTESMISGRLSFYLLAVQAYQENLSFADFIRIVNTILGQELKEGKIDETSLEILKDFTYPDGGLPGV
jgi:hypothetical protein